MQYETIVKSLLITSVNELIILVTILTTIIGFIYIGKAVRKSVLLVEKCYDDFI